MLNRVSSERNVQLIKLKPEDFVGGIHVNEFAPSTLADMINIIN